MKMRTRKPSDLGKKIDEMVGTTIPISSYGPVRHLKIDFIIVVEGGICINGIREFFLSYEDILEGKLVL